MKSISVTVINEDNFLSLEEITRAIHADHDLILQLIEYHIIQPVGDSKNNWQFDHVCLKRARLARNFYYECEVNLAGIGLLLDMMERVEMLEAEIRRR